MKLENIKPKEKVFEVSVKVMTDIPLQVIASSEKDARRQVIDEVNMQFLQDIRHFLRENAHDFVHNSEIDDAEYWHISEVTDERDIYIEYQTND